MRNYCEAPYSSMSVPESPELNDALFKIFSENKIPFILETGTYLGQGSTRIIAEAILKAKASEVKAWRGDIGDHGQLVEALGPVEFKTLEADRGRWEQAKANLAKYPFIECVWGSSLKTEAAKNFINSDTALNNPDYYPDIYIDPMSPQEYLGESNGNSGKDNLFEELICPAKKKYPYNPFFIALDSAGGVGWLEFQKVDSFLRKRNYFIFLDDVEHIKHFRSKEYMENPYNNYKILVSKDGWLIASHQNYLPVYHWP